MSIKHIKPFLITIGAFFGAMDVWGWHWGFSALFSTPGLAFLIPGVILSIINESKAHNK